MGSREVAYVLLPFPVDFLMDAVEKPFAKCLAKACAFSALLLAQVP
jgi:hypothetical protein